MRFVLSYPVNEAHEGNSFDSNLHEYELWNNIVTSCDQLGVKVNGNVLMFCCLSGSALVLQNKVSSLSLVNGKKLALGELYSYDRQIWHESE